MSDLEAATAPVVGLDSVPDVHHHGVAAWAGRRFRAEMLNWRLALVRVFSSAVAVVVTVLLVPGLGFRDRDLRDFVVIGLVFGLLNAIVKPVLQFFTLRYLLPTYGLVVVLVNAVMLWLLSWVLNGEVQVFRTIGLILGGLVVGVVGLLLDTLLGATPPIIERQGRFGGSSAGADQAGGLPEVNP